MVESDEGPEWRWPKLADVGVVIACLFVLVWLLACLGSDDVRARLQSAGEAVAAVAAIAAAAAALIAVRQLELQRGALAGQQRALTAQRFQRLRDDYAAWFDAATRSAIETTNHAQHSDTLAPLNTALQRLLLADADDLRSCIYADVTEQLMASRPKSTLGNVAMVLQLAEFGRKLKRLSDRLIPATPRMRGYGKEFDAFLALRTEADIPKASLQDILVGRVHVISLALHCIRQLLEFEERGVIVVPGTDADPIDGARMPGVPD